MIVEIGDKPLVRRAYPDAVVHFSTVGGGQETDIDGWGLAPLLALNRALRDPALRLVVCHPTFFAPWQPAAITRALFDRRVFRRPFPLLRAYGPQLLRWPVGVPLVVVDHEDLPLINRNTLFLLRRSSLYFKRELPPDRWRLFTKTAHPNLPTPRFRRTSPIRHDLGKIRPISLGLPLPTPEPFPVDPQEKTVDLFFAGHVGEQSSVRTRGLAELRALAERGFVVDIPEQRLPPLEFLRRCARALVVWSPEGLGWDCFRHYEAGACGSVPLINQPTIERYAPLLDRQHAIYYDVEPGGLTRAVLQAFADREHLTRCGLAARAHVLGHHTPRQIARYIVDTALGGTDATPP